MKRLRKILRVPRRLLAIAFVTGLIVPAMLLAFGLGFRRVAQASAK